MVLGYHDVQLRASQKPWTEKYSSKPCSHIRKNPIAQKFQDRLRSPKLYPFDKSTAHVTTVASSSSSAPKA
ncbi:hypothetical protein CIPAW_16G106500 [Carya illinoinensis]|uniref:Uncharacterized protein n=1 Tax=Carya illinoinensis TaxID=32201 RepID=A0A8T1N7W3_CARIL|nr:hypothetical protein CIPAW_16G106500 [Carya illinoinensis]